MQRTDIGPRQIMGQLAYHRAVKVAAPQEWLVLAGHEDRGADGKITHPGEIEAQIIGTLENLRATVEESGFTMADVVQLRIVTTDIKAMTSNYSVLMEWLGQHECGPATLMAEVTALSDPAMLVEIEGLAAR